MIMINEIPLLRLVFMRRQSGKYEETRVVEKEQEKSVESSSRGVSGDEVVSCRQSHGHALVVTHGDLPLTGGWLPCQCRVVVH